MLGVLGICAGCSKPSVATPKQFTAEYAKALKEASPTLKVDIVQDLELKVIPPAGGEHTCFLDNAYEMYKQDPNTKTEVINRFVAASIETVLSPHDRLDRSRIVPVIKDRPWLAEMREGLKTRGAKKAPEPVYEDLSKDLVIVYAEDTPKNMRYFNRTDLEEAKIDPKELRGIATENLKRIIPKIERHGENGLYMFTAGGDYEASLLLFDSIWEDLRTKVKGDIVVAVPTRDLLVVTGSEDADGLQRVRKVAKDATATGTYRLTSQLFLYENGKLTEFREAPRTSSTPHQP
jgi:uncharacterized protein YtpQ (UPF0354 family)